MRIGNRNRKMLINLLAEQRNDGAAGSHHVAIARKAENRIPFLHLTAAGDDIFLHQCLGHAHRIDRISGLICGKEDRLLHMIGYAGGNHIVRAKDIGLHRLDRIKLAGRNLLQRRRMEHIVRAAERTFNRVIVTHITDIELQLFEAFGIFGLIAVAHIVLLLFVAGDNTDLLDVRI